MENEQERIIECVKELRAMYPDKYISIKKDFNCFNSDANHIEIVFNIYVEHMGHSEKCCSLVALEEMVQHIIVQDILKSQSKRIIV